MGILKKMTYGPGWYSSWRAKQRGDLKKRWRSAGLALQRELESACKTKKGDLKKDGGLDGTRTRDPRRDRPVF